MADNNYIPGNLVVGGRFQCSSYSAPSESITTTNFSSAIGDRLEATKQVHQHQVQYNQKHGTAVVTERKPVHIAKGTGSIVEVEAALVVACIGDSTIVVNLYKNGSTVLSGTISFDSGDAAFAKLLATVSSASYVDGDVFEVVVTATVGTGTLGQGLIVNVTLREQPE